MKDYIIDMSVFMILVALFAGSLRLDARGSEEAREFSLMGYLLTFFFGLVWLAGSLDPNIISVTEGFKAVMAVACFVLVVASGRLFLQEIVDLFRNEGSGQWLKDAGTKVLRSIRQLA